MKTSKTISTRLKFLCCLMIGALASGPLPIGAADMTAGYSFTPNDRVTSTKLNNLVGAGSINTSFITDKTSVQPQASDTFLLYSVSATALRKTTLNTLLLQNTNLIVGQTEKVPTTNDSLLIYSVADNALRKSTFLDLFTNQFWIDNQQRTTNPPPGGGLLTYSSNGVFYGIAVSNLLQETWRWMPLSTNSPTNSVLSLHTTPTNDDLLLIWDSVAKTNKAIRLQTVISNATRVNVRVTNSSDYILWGMRTNDTNVIGINPKRFQTVGTLQFPVAAAAGHLTQAHGLPGMPSGYKMVLLCTNAEAPYAVGDEVDSSIIWTTPQNTLTVDAVNVDLSGGNVSTITIGDKNGSTHSITKINWNYKVYLYYYPP